MNYSNSSILPPITSKSLGRESRRLLHIYKLLYSYRSTDPLSFKETIKRSKDQLMFEMIIADVWKSSIENIRKCQFLEETLLQIRSILRYTEKNVNHWPSTHAIFKKMIGNFPTLKTLNPYLLSIAKKWCCWIASPPPALATSAGKPCWRCSFNLTIPPNFQVYNFPNKSLKAT